MMTVDVVIMVTIIKETATIYDIFAIFKPHLSFVFKLRILQLIQDYFSNFLKKSVLQKRF